MKHFVPVVCSVQLCPFGAIERVGDRWSLRKNVYNIILAGWADRESSCRQGLGTAALKKAGLM